MPEGTIRMLRFNRDKTMYFKDRYTVWCRFKGWSSSMINGYYFDHAQEVD